MAIDINKMKRASGTTSQKRVDTRPVEIPRAGSQISVYFDADDMELLTKLKYQHPTVPRGKILKYALKLMREQEVKPSSSEIMGYSS